MPKNHENEISFSLITNDEGYCVLKNIRKDISYDITANHPNYETSA